MKNITGKRSVKAIAAFFITIMMWDIIFPAAALALTGGPSQPEVQSFEPVGTTEMVDLFSGDFVYNIPLVDVEGFPINISYHSGVGMDDEASWVGLGWNINPGVINRNMRGIPDDFQGDQVKTTTNIKENQTWGANINASVELFGYELTKKGNKKEGLDFKIDLGASLGVFYNNYRGLGAETSINPTFRLSDRSQAINNSFNLGLGLGFSANSQQGADVGANLSFAHGIKILKRQGIGSLSFGASVNSRNGMEKLTFGYGYARETIHTIRRNGQNLGETGMRSAPNINGGFFLNPNSYTPQVNNELKNVSINLSLSAGVESFGINWQGGVSGYFQTQFLKNRVRENNAYGYLYTQDALDGDNPGGNVMYDLNRENDGEYTKGKPYLPMPIYTYDMFSVAGEGTGGLIRPFRSDVGVMTDATTKSTTVGVGLGFGHHLGAITKLEGDLSGNYGYTRSGMWRYNNQSDFDIVKHLNFNKPASASSFEPAYFRRTGELTKANNDIYSELKDNSPVRIIVENNPHGRLSSTIIDRGGGQKNITKKLKQNSRQARNMAVSMLTNKEASKVGLNRNIKIYEQNVFEIEGKTIKPDTVIPRETDGNFKSKMSELTITNPDGRRYVYDLPAYNNFQYDAAFRVVDVANPSSLVKDRSTGLVKYNAGDNSTGNGRGEDNFYTKNELPAYAHSFLLTSILSPDYVDITGNGVSDDDIGTAVKINYTRAYKNFRWRTPFGNGTREANYDEGLKSDIYDDRGNYIYGEKEIWYTHSIESKNYVACFYTSQRNDGHGVLNEDGGIDATKSFYKLDSIKLFTKKELELNGASATPLKTVHFEYDYSLCLNAQNNENYDTTSSAIQEATGKLTLKKIYFTYGNSRKGRTNSYQFTYSDFNPIYNLRGYDRWGNYKPNPTNAQMGNIDDVSTPLSNVDDPYVLQNKDSADLYASAWSLTSIKLPSGGTINVNYESDDYAYIQDKQAGQMFKVVGINSSNTFKNDASNLFETTSNKNFIFFDLDEPISKSASAEEIENKKNDYVGGNEKIYFKFLVDLTGDGDYEYVPGYADKLQVGFQSRNPTDTEYDLGFIELEEVALQKSGFEKINPISKASWNFMRLYAPKKLAKIFSGYEPPPASTNPVGVAKSLVGSVSEMLNMVRGFGKRMRAKGAGQKFVFNKSFIRLNNPNKTKYGGGVRVKQISLSDDWDNMVSGQEASSYGQNYIYTKQEKQTDGTYKTISSGVATWEPSIGGDENSHKQPAEYTQSNTLAPDDQYMVELPIGESLYPAPSVGYSQVTTINIKPSENIKRTATGKVVNEFFTAKDFPVITSNTEVDNQSGRNVPRFLSQLLKVYVKDKAFVSQGYSVELNDMHGKPKAQWVYEEDNNVPISGVKYHYNYKINEQGKNQLISKVDVVNPDGSITSAEMGRENDFMFDMRNNYSFHAGATLQGNLDAFLASILPVVVPTLFSSLSIQELEFGSAVNTKVIMRYGILKETEVFENGATVKTQNVLFDSETGDVLLAKTTNEFDDTIYTFNYPAHFAYEGMGQAYKNIGYYFKDIKLIDGELHNLSNYTDFIFPGDELYVETEVGGSTDISYIKLWAVESPHYAGELIFLTRTGAPYSTANVTGEKYNLKIVRSGRRNMQSTSIGSVVSLNNPVVNGTLSFDSIINSGAVEFTQEWTSKNLYVYEDIYAFPNSATPIVKPESPACNDSCLRELKTLLFPAMALASVGDTINLMEAPYKDYFLCQLPLGEKIGCPSSEKDYYRDSLLIKGGTFSLSGYAFNEDIEKAKDFRYAEIEKVNFNSSNNLEFAPTVLLLKRSNAYGISNEDKIDIGLTTSNKSSTNIITPGCDMCDAIVNTGTKDSVTEYFTEDGCKRRLVSKCTDIEDKPENEDCEVPKVEVLECATSGNPAFISLYGMTLPAGHPANKCGDVLMLIYDYGDVCGNSGGKANKSLCVVSDFCKECVGSCDTLNTQCGDTLFDGYPITGFINPYVYGTKGNWRPKRNWLFYDKRNQATITNIRKDGTYKNYTDFWKKPIMTGGLWDTGSSVSNKWVWNTEVTKFNRTGNEIENKDALDIYSAALFGYGQSMVTAVGNNAKQRQIAFDGFEDYKFYTNSYEEHFSFYEFRNRLDSLKSHTGVYSIALNNNEEVSYLNYTFFSESETDTTTIDTSINAVLLRPKNLIEHFSPDTGNYIISAWVKEDLTSPKYGGSKDTLIVKLIEKNCQTSYKFIPSGPIIEGWQRIVGEFTVPDSITAYKVILKSDGVDKAYFDDVRIHPWNGNMKSFVYHPLTLRLMAELDENNYATFYEYDDEGRLVRIKRETERGIVTLQESRTGLKINEE
jgi:hypothetical protein